MFRNFVQILSLFLLINVISANNIQHHQKDVIKFDLQQQPPLQAPQQQQSQSNITNSLQTSESKQSNTVLNQQQQQQQPTLLTLEQQQELLEQLAQLQRQTQQLLAAQQSLAAVAAAAAVNTGSGNPQHQQQQPQQNTQQHHRQSSQQQPQVQLSRQQQQSNAGQQQQSTSSSKPIQNINNRIDVSTSGGQSSSNQNNNSNNSGLPQSPQINWGKCPELEPSEQEKLAKANVITKCLETTPLPVNITRESVEQHREQIAACALRSEGWFTSSGGYDFNKAEKEIKNKHLQKDLENQVLNYHSQCRIESEDKYPSSTNSSIIAQIQLYQACMDYFISDVCGIEVNDTDVPQF